MTDTSTPSPQAPTPVGDNDLNWSDARLLGFKPMDDTHEEFYTVVQALLTSDAEDLLPRLAAFETHAVAHFGQEDAWMQTTEFPARDCHIDEHAAVLKSAREVIEHVGSGQAGLPLVQDFALHLLHWFPGHADYLDSALAGWMSKRAYGGKPVVLRRNLDLAR